MSENASSIRSRLRFAPLLTAVALSAALLMAGCTGMSWTDALDWGACEDYAGEYASEMEASGVLMSSVPTETANYPMALVLSQSAVNSLFQRLADVALPELSESTTVFGQRVGVAVQPAIPLLQIGGTESCTDCISAQVPFDVGLTMAGIDLPRGSGSMTAQMPIRLVPEGDTRTALVAQFQSVQVTDLQLDFLGSVANNILDAVLPIVNTLLTRFVTTRFADAHIVSMDSWSIGQGEVLLAGRGPFIFPDQGTIVVAMQSNLPLQGQAQLQTQAALPAGAEIGIMIHPGLLGSMGRRMLFENVIPQSYNESGEADANGTVRATLQSVGSSDDGLMRATATLWRTGSMCGAADLSASIAFSAAPQGVTFAMQDLDVSNERGSGQILAYADQLSEGFVESLLETLEFTVNYDEVFGGELQQQAAVETFQFNVDGRGVSLFLDLAD